MLAHLHMMAYTWWCWHTCKGEIIVELDQLEEEKELRQGDRTPTLKGAGPCFGGTLSEERSAVQTGLGIWEQQDPSA